MKIGNIIAFGLLMGVLIGLGIEALVEVEQKRRRREVLA